MMDNDGHNVPTLRVSSPPQSLHNAYQQPPWMKSKRNGLAASRRADKMKNRRERSARNRSASCPVTMKKPLGTIVECDEEEEEEGKKFELEEQMKKEKEVQDFLKKKGKRHNGHLFESYNQTNICAIDGIRPRSWSVGSPISNQCNPMLSAKRTSRKFLFSIRECTFLYHYCCRCCLCSVVLVVHKRMKAAFSVFFLPTKYKYILSYTTNINVMCVF
eukprot:m.66524 g.66524  ORF g.66524 m.66524 type:complete len:217 (+) comp11556_c0_seq2:156-806(+)